VLWQLPGVRQTVAIIVLYECSMMLPSESAVYAGVCPVRQLPVHCTWKLATEFCGFDSCICCRRRCCRVVEDLRRTAFPRAQLEIMICDLTDFE
jgi:hypothetical protein